ncbi:hypothetical protein WICPIJ_002813 [Wickerhamomyces pijperi]|uniref:Uncharacterized protein n=1 Tax=Wickerhamomyces pijperi TaxID=599730 RepID=A0A9P8Q8G6_WICPI|nr:hypothetical protein WICPIJ_002813 [Wickerhamomyces pijperi]
MESVLNGPDDGTVLVSWDELQVLDGVPVRLSNGSAHLNSILPLTNTNHTVLVPNNNQRVVGRDLPLGCLVGDTLHDQRLSGESFDVLGVQPGQQGETLGDDGVLSGGGFLLNDGARWDVNLGLLQLVSEVDV